MDLNLYLIRGQKDRRKLMQLRGGALIDLSICESKSYCSSLWSALGGREFPLLGGYFTNSLQEGMARNNFSGLNVASCVHLHLNDNFAAGICR